jgi:hypothetical protein
MTPCWAMLLAGATSQPLPGCLGDLAWNTGRQLDVLGVATVLKMKVFLLAQEI